MLNSYKARQPVAIAIGECKLAAGFVVGRFLGRLGEDTAVARITRPCANAAELMRRIVRSVGFDPKDMSVSDLQSVLRMFAAQSFAWSKSRTPNGGSSTGFASWWSSNFEASLA